MDNIKLVKLNRISSTSQVKYNSHYINELPKLKILYSEKDQRYKSYFKYSSKKITDTLNIKNSIVTSLSKSSIPQKIKNHKKVNSLNIINNPKINLLMSVLPKVLNSRNNSKLILRKEISMKETIRKEKEYQYKLLKSNKLHSRQRSCLFLHDNSIKINDMDLFKL